MRTRRHPLKVGILGGGQLARMLAMKAHELGLSPYVLSPNPTDPAALVTRHWQKGSIDSLKDLKIFFSKVDIATFESEFCDPDIVKQALQTHRVPLFPRISTIGKIQDRWPQKKMIEKAGLKTARFVKVERWNQVENLFSFFPNGFVLKKRRFGYDGFGTFIIKNTKQLKALKPLWEQETCGFIAEDLIAFDRELAVVAFRGKKGDFTHLPLVESFQHQARCLWVKGPIYHIKFKSTLKKIQNLMETQRFVGALAFEFFEYKNELWVNEVAPRVHNSGHFSLNGTQVDQFTLHLKAITGDQLPEVQLNSLGFGMYNLIGQSHKNPTWKNCSDVSLHWYEKSENRPGRKMGHLNATAKTANQALSKLEKSVKGFKL